MDLKRISRDRDIKTIREIGALHVRMLESSILLKITWLFITKRILLEPSIVNLQRSMFEVAQVEKARS